jgi:hypothetical protein
MLIKPNKTAITATILSPINEEGNFDIVILSIPGKVVLPAFLWAGKILTVEGKNLDTNVSIEKGKVISAKIEVYGDPFTQKYFLYDVAQLGHVEKE